MHIKKTVIFSKNIKPTIIVDAGIATEENIKRLTGNDYKYITVSRKQYRQFDETLAITVKKQTI